MRYSFFRVRGDCVEVVVEVYHATVMPCFDKKLEATRDDFYSVITMHLLYNHCNYYINTITVKRWDYSWIET